MKMKNYLYSLLVIMTSMVMVTGLVACGGDDDSGNSGNTSGGTDTPTGITMSRLAGTWQAIEASGTGYDGQVNTKELTGLDSLDTPVLIVLQPDGRYKSYDPDYRDYTYINGIQVPAAYAWRPNGIYGARSGEGTAMLVGRQLQLTDDGGNNYSILLEIVSLTEQRLIVKYRDSDGAITVTYGRDGDGADYFRYPYINHAPKLTGRWRMTYCSEDGAPVGYDYYYNADGTGYSTGDQKTFTYTHDATGRFTIAYSGGGYGLECYGYITITGNKPGAGAVGHYYWNNNNSKENYIQFQKISDETYTPPTPTETRSIVGKWNVVYVSSQRYEGATLTDSYEGAKTAPYDYIQITDNTFTYMEYSNSRGTWHEDGTGTWRMDGTKFVFTSSDFDYMEVISYDGNNNMVVSSRMSEDKDSYVVTKQYVMTLQRAN